MPKDGYAKHGKKGFIKDNPGRPKGARGEFTNLKQSFLDAFQELGGSDALLKWAREERGKGKNKHNPNLASFFLLISKMLPKQVELSGTEGLPITINVVNYSKAKGEDGKKK